MRLGILSDIHANYEALSAVLEAYTHEDITEYYCLGDTVGYGGSPNECAEVVRGLAKATILGNHDAITNPPLIIRAFQDHGIPVLRNTSIPLERGSGRIWLAGIDDLLRGTPRIDLTLQGIPPDETTILLAHEPDYADQVSLLPVDLQLSGHSHGGQIWIPGIGSPETLEWSARHHYPYIYLETDPQVTVQMTELYNKAAAEVGYRPGPQNFGYLWRIHVQDTDEKANEAGKGFLIGNAGIGRVPMPGDFMAPAGKKNGVIIRVWEFK